MEQIQIQIETFAGAWTPCLLVLLFLLSSLLIIWRLEMMSQRGVEGTVLGTLFMPYFSGLGNLIFVAVLLTRNGAAEEIAINAWTNNITNLCLLLALPALIWGLRFEASSKAKKAQRASKLHQLSLALTLLAMIFFCAITWMLAQDGALDRFDGCVLVSLFLFWQCFHVFEVLKENARSASGWHPLILLDLTLILFGSFITLIAVDGIVGTILSSSNPWFGPAQLGLLTGWLMVLPNAVLAFYYAAKRRAEIVYSSQVGDGHICIPLAIGLFAIFKPVPISALFAQGLLLLATAATIHLICAICFRALPKLIAVGLLIGYGYSLYWQLTL